ncbi:MAG: DNA internalization-related competence protein ComEC/Rec2, partial [Mycobacteriales bacterium]
AVLSARGPPEDVSPPSALQRTAGSLRAGLRRACRPLPSAERGLLPGLVIGDTTAMDPALAEDFRTTGMTHLLAVSGTNCAIVSGAVLLMSRRLRAGPRAAALLAGLALLGFVVLARPSPSVLRAAVMGALALLALALGRSRAALPGLCAAVLLLVLLDPALARSAGFALSVAATAGLLLLAAPWRDALRRRLPPGAAEAIAVPAAAQVACTPLIAAISGQIGLVAVPANLLAVPAVAPATVLGVAAALVSPVWPLAAEFLARLAAVPTSWLVLVARHGAHVPGAVLSWPAGTVGALSLAGVLALALVLGRARSVRQTAMFAAGLTAVFALPLRVVAPGWPPPGWVMVACDVGQGDALVLAAGPGSAIVVDTGPEPSAVDGCLRRLRIRRIPLLVITHLHADHVGGLSGVERGRSVAAIEVGPLREPAPAWHSLQHSAAVAHIPIVSAAVGEVRRVAALNLQVLAPAGAFSGTRSDPNNSSIMLRVRVSGRTLLLAGDAEVAAQQALLGTGTDVRADVLKVAHHGSSYQDWRFLSAAHPALALVSVGADNPYGHPSTAVLDRLRRLGARVERTDRDGDIAVAVQSGRLLVVARGPAHRRPLRSAPHAGSRAPPHRR